MNPILQQRFFLHMANTAKEMQKNGSLHSNQPKPTTHLSVKNKRRISKLRQKKIDEGVKEIIHVHERIKKCQTSADTIISTHDAKKQKKETLSSIEEQLKQVEEITTELHKSKELSEKEFSQTLKLIEQLEKVVKEKKKHLTPHKKSKK